MSKKKKSTSASVKNTLTDTKQTDTKTQTSPQLEDTLSFPIVGIGASAGGLEAFEQFFSTFG
ncbi:MAG: hypothetical protein DWQ04_23055 [Chloroflexi bacterium]|nr:MAG: hypothetical protein DWQ04_23055 [Chloroflexota bacterium]